MGNCQPTCQPCCSEAKKPDINNELSPIVKSNNCGEDISETEFRIRAQTGDLILFKSKHLMSKV